jgi:hypothetical protein
VVAEDASYSGWLGCGDSTVVFRTQSPLEFSHVILLDGLGIRPLIRFHLNPDHSARHCGWLEVAERLVKKPLLFAKLLPRRVHPDSNLLRALVGRLASRVGELAVEELGDPGCRGCSGRTLGPLRGFCFRRK